MSWKVLESGNPELAEHGRRLLYQEQEIAAAYLATVAPDGGPRVHPVFPVLADSELWLFIVAMSPKFRDLERNGHYALHSFPLQGGGEEFHIRGTAQHVSDTGVKAAVVATTQGRQGTQEFEMLFRCEISSALYTRWDNWGTEAAWPNYLKWTSLD